MSLFEQTQYEADMLFYATFPAARDAAYNAASKQSICDFFRPADCPSLREAAQLLQYDIRDLDIGGASMSESFQGPTQEPSYPQIHPYSHHQSQSYYSPTFPVSFLFFTIFYHFFV